MVEETNEISMYVTATPRPEELKVEKEATDLIIKDLEQNDDHGALSNINNTINQTKEIFKEGISLGSLKETLELEYK